MPYDTYQLPKRACPAFILKSHRRHILCITSPLPKGEEHLSNNAQALGSVPSTPRGEKRPYISYAICKHSSHLEMFLLPSKASSTQFKFSQYSSQINYIFTNYNITILSHLDKWLLKILISPFKKLCISCG